MTRFGDGSFQTAERDLVTGTGGSGLGSPGTQSGRKTFRNTKTFSLPGAHNKSSLGPEQQTDVKDAQANGGTHSSITGSTPPVSGVQPIASSPALAIQLQSLSKRDRLRTHASKPSLGGSPSGPSPSPRPTEPAMAIPGVINSDELTSSAASLRVKQGRGPGGIPLRPGSLVAGMAFSPASAANAIVGGISPDTSARGAQPSETSER